MNLDDVIPTESAAKWRNLLFARLGADAARRNYAPNVGQIHKRCAGKKVCDSAP